MSQNEASTGASTEASHAQGPFTLSGAVARPDPRSVPLRGDLAHIALAGKHFVPHYAVPQPRAVMPGGASLRAAADDDAEEICVLMEGDSFEVLDVAGQWAWGCLSVEGPVGYIRSDLLETVE
ncbi:SH3 domain-containing protein [Aurantiacibacter sp. MUD61]|uniref:SH3 domain-containing protein n=1 Tax=Aurantiacibacter sp. MUD61 TaxID=3009083 RepID=UPI0022F11995|nr:SH3 domain-containing protein [Aurantiacibacter sp. MUD61]